MQTLLKRIDPWIVACIIFIGGISVATMFSYAGTDTFGQRQILWLALGLVVYCVTALFANRTFFEHSRALVVFYGITAALLVLVLLVGSTINGAQSWIPLGIFSFQPADLAKIILMLLLAKYLSRRHVVIHHMRHIVVTACYLLGFVGLILLQPDFGSAMVLVALWLGIMFVSGISRKHLVLLIAAGLLMAVIAWLFVFKPYQKARIVSFVHPLSDIRGTGYNAYQSVVAVGSGGMLGKGVGYGSQSRLAFLPEHHTDFIFASFAEEWGFVGVLLLLGLYALLCSRLLYYTNRMDSNFSFLFTLGVLFLFLIHIGITVGMNIGIAPIVGLPLPLASYGGSHILIECFALGLCSNFARSRSAVYHGKMTKEFHGL